MITEIKVTDLPESVQEATLAHWHKKTGDRVKAGEKIADMETDKIVIEITASVAGSISKLNKKEGETIRRGDTIAQIDTDGSAAAQPPKAAEPRPSPARAPAPPVATAPAETPAATAGKELVLPVLDELSPSVRKLVVENKINPKDVAGSGKGGRITKADVVRHLEHSPHLATQFGAGIPDLPVEKAPAPTQSAMSLGRPEERVKMTRLRARIAERLIQAQQSAAILTTFNEVNMHAVMSLRTRYKEQFEKEHGVKLGFMSFFVKAAVEALSKHPIVNASLDGEDIIYHGYYDIGVAVSTGRGLIVPVLRDANKLSLADIESAIADYAKRGEDGKLGMDELTGGTFTISNGGVFGSLLSTPILNPPQSAILGMHRIQPRPVAENDQVVIRPMMYLALSYDHRIIDGKEAVLFLVAIKDALEDPSRLLLQI